MNKESVLVVGSANMDLVVFTDKFPDPGETVFGHSFEMFPGGKGANQAVSCARLGSKTYFMGKMGKDGFAEALIASMKKDNIDLSHSLTDPDSVTGTALISVDKNGENEIIVISGANMELVPEEINQCDSLFREVNVVLTQLEIPLTTVKNVAVNAKKVGAKFILNPAPAKILDDELLQQIDILTPNEIELEFLTGIQINDIQDVEKGAKLLLGKGVKNVIVTLGKRGALLVNSNEVKSFKTMQVQAVDSTAAGDTFNGALACSLAKGMSLEDSIKFSTKAAAISVTKKGAQNSMPTLEDISFVN